MASKDRVVEVETDKTQEGAIGGITASKVEFPKSSFTKYREQLEKLMDSSENGEQEFFEDDYLQQEHPKRGPSPLQVWALRDEARKKLLGPKKQPSIGLHELPDQVIHQVAQKGHDMFQVYESIQHIYELLEKKLEVTSDERPRFRQREEALNDLKAKTYNEVQELESEQQKRERLQLGVNEEFKIPKLVEENQASCEAIDAAGVTAMCGTFYGTPKDRHDIKHALRQAFKYALMRNHSYSHMEYIFTIVLKGQPAKDLDRFLAEHGDEKINRQHCVEFCNRMILQYQPVRSMATFKSQVDRFERRQEETLIQAGNRFLDLLEDEIGPTPSKAELESIKQYSLTRKLPDMVAQRAKRDVEQKIAEYKRKGIVIKNMDILKEIQEIEILSGDTYKARQYQANVVEVNAFARYKHDRHDKTAKDRMERHGKALDKRKELRYLEMQRNRENNQFKAKPLQEYSAPNYANRKPPKSKYPYDLVNRRNYSTTNRTNYRPGYSNPYYQKRNQNPNRSSPNNTDSLQIIRQNRRYRGNRPILYLCPKCANFHTEMWVKAKCARQGRCYKCNAEIPANSVIAQVIARNQDREEEEELYPLEWTPDNVENTDSRED